MARRVGPVKVRRYSHEDTRTPRALGSFSPHPLPPLFRHRASFRVTLLGTGSPGASVERFGPSTLVEVGNQKLIFDVGAATIRLNQLGVSLRDVTAVFVTHLHSDHVNGLSDLWLTRWLPGAGGGGDTPFRVFGPLGTREMMSNLERAHQADIRIRTADQQLPASGIRVDATDVSEGVVYDREGVRVTVFDVDHGEEIKPALGYRWAIVVRRS